jgi:hypothetical protein
MEKYRRKNRKNSRINSLTEAQKIAFAPLSFQMIGTFLDLGILKILDEKKLSEKEIQKELNLTEYIVKTLLQTGLAVGIVEKSEENKFFTSKLGQAFLYDEMTKINFNFVRNVCYLGASELTASFLNEKPEGLKKFFKNIDTIYPILTKLPALAKKSWFDFDNYYSDTCFQKIFEIISEKNPSEVFDIGANTAKFEQLALKKNDKIKFNIIDLPENIEVIKKNKQLKACKFFNIDVLSETNDFPQMSNAVLMSQFLDCFSKEQIVFILKKIAKKVTNNTKIYILEPLIDKQNFDGAKYSLIHTSLYFTCMANGKSKMYEFSEFEELINFADLKIIKVYNEIGAHDYTLLECEKQ